MLLLESALQSAMTIMYAEYFSIIYLGQKHFSYYLCAASYALVPIYTKC